MLDIKRFKCFLQEKNKKVNFDSMPLSNQYVSYDRYNYYYNIYYNIGEKNFVTLNTMDLLSLCDIYSITSSDRTRTLVFPDKSKLVFTYYERTATEIRLRTSFTAPNGSAYNQLSNLISYSTTIPLNKSKVLLLVLAGPTDFIPKVNMPSELTEYYYAGVGMFYFLNADLTNYPSSSLQAQTITNKNSTAIVYGNYIIGALIHAQYKDPKFYSDISTTGGGDGDYEDNASDTIGLPDLTALNQNSISNTKFLTCYKMTPAQLSKLGDELWSDNIFTQISNTVLKPTDFIVNLSLLPVDVGGVTKLIKAGKILLNGSEGTLISQQFIRVDCGSLEVKKKWGGAIDYQTDVSIFLPFIGEQSLNANEVMGASLNVIYTVDILSGSCIASVRVIKDSLDAVLYQFSGNMASNFPITSADYATVFSGALQLAVGVGSLPSSGGVLSLVSATSNMLSGADVKRTGSLSSASGFMGIKKPYLILSRPIQSLPSEYNTFRGYVSNITLSLSECSGYTKVAEIHLENIPATSAELDELDGLLKAGVIF
mgnify:CR=1 FL=1